MITARELTSKIDELALSQGDFIRDLPIKWGKAPASPCIAIDGDRVSVRLAMAPTGALGRARRDPHGTANVV